MHLGTLQEGLANLGNDTKPNIRNIISKPKTDPDSNNYAANDGLTNRITSECNGSLFVKNPTLR